jgi:hypothetical protein
MATDVNMAEASSSSNELAPTQHEPITDGQADIAMTSDMDKMKVELVGRQPLQKVWLWTGSNEQTEGKKKTTSSLTTNKQYKPENDGPDVAGLPGALPTEQERVPHETAVEYLEVGLVIGEEPQRVKRTHKGRMKETRPTLTREPTALRAFIPITPYVAEQAKYYVGCKPTAGRCFPLVIDGDSVFFYAEFWHGLPEKANKKERRSFVNAKTKYHAAVNKTAVDRSAAAITFTEAEKRVSSNSLAVTQPDSVASTLLLLLTLFLETGNRDYLKSMLRVMEDAAPDFNVGPYAANTGVVAFYDFNDELSEDDARSVKRELKVSRLHVGADTVYNIDAYTRLPSLTCQISMSSKSREFIVSCGATAGATVFRTATSHFLGVLS